MHLLKEQPSSMLLVLLTALLGASGAYKALPPGTTWQWQLTGTLDTSRNVKMYDIDMYKYGKSAVQKLKNNGKIVICYFSAGTWEAWRDFASKFPPSVRGATLDHWPDEKWLDIRTSTVRNVMKWHMDNAKSWGCDGVEPDNVDAWDNNGGGFKPKITAKDQLDYNKFLASYAHSKDLSVGLKNDAEQVNDLESHFDWSLTEECVKYTECNKYYDFIKKSKAVFHVEYYGSGYSISKAKAKRDKICSKRPKEFSTLVKSWDVDKIFVPC